MAWNRVQHGGILAAGRGGREEPRSVAVARIGRADGDAYHGTARGQVPRTLECGSSPAVPVPGAAEGADERMRFDDESGGAGRL